MAHMALYRKWRPMTFEEVVEQRHIVTALKNSIINNSINHAYLFCGTRGTGKTTMAKIFSRAINCLSPEEGNPCNQCSNCLGILDSSIVDVIEIDAASNNGVDDVRQIKEAVMYVPALTPYKVYIIDEVHMLSIGAFNALLKILEEPPKNVVFILATTEPHKLPATILSRCQRFDFRRITTKGLVSRLKLIAQSCGLDLEDSAAHLIARVSKGGMRDAISLLDQCMSLNSKAITNEIVTDVSGLTASETVISLAEAIIEKDTMKALTAIDRSMDEGRDPQPFCNQLIEWFRNLMLIKTGKETHDLVDFDDRDLMAVEKLKGKIDMDRIIYILKELSETEGRLKWSDNQRILLEVTVVKLCANLTGPSMDEIAPGKSIDEYAAFWNNRFKKVESKLTELEKKIALNTKVEQPTDTKYNNVNIIPQTAQPVINNEKKVKNEQQNLEINYLKQWPDIIEWVRKAGKMKIYAYLLDTKCIIKDQSAFVVVPSEDNLKKTVLGRSESLKIIKEALTSVTGADLDIKIADDKMLAIKDNTKEDPILKKLKDLAEENNIELEIKE